MGVSPGTGSGYCKSAVASALSGHHGGNEGRVPMIDPTRRDVLATGAAATVLAAAPRTFAQDTAQGVPAQGTPRMSVYERGPVRIRYEEAGSGFPLLLIPGGGLNASIAN